MDYTPNKLKGKNHNEQFQQQIITLSADNIRFTSIHAKKAGS